MLKTSLYFQLAQLSLGGIHRLCTLLLVQDLLGIVIFRDIVERVVVTAYPATEEPEVISWQTIYFGILTPCDTVAIRDTDAGKLVQVDACTDVLVVDFHLNDAAVLQQGLVSVGKAERKRVRVRMEMFWLIISTGTAIT